MSKGTVFIGGTFGNGGGQGGTTDYTNLFSKTYADLKALRDAGKLIAGAYYRITDYMATTGSFGTVAINDLPFDIIVTATSESTLSENALACERDGHEYDQYLKPDFRAWELKYCLDNDITRFSWADENDGKGVVYRLIDEHNNSVGYDYKNIGFEVEFFRSLDSRIDALAESEGFDFSTANYIRLYSIQLQDGSVADASVYCRNLPNFDGEEIGVRNNYIGDMHFGNNYADLPFAAFLNGYGDSPHFMGIAGTTCKGQSIRDLSDGSTFLFAAGSNCSHWTAGANCTSFVVYLNCSYWTAGDLNFGWTAGEESSYWTTGSACYGWSVGKRCTDWSVGEYCHSWRTGDDCAFWSAGNGNYGWSVGTGCSHWAVGNNCSGWTTGDRSHSWSVGHSSKGWMVGNQSSSWRVSGNCNGWQVGNNCNRWTADSGCHYWKVANATRSFHILSAVKFSELTQLPVVAAKDYTQLVALRKDGTVRVWCPEEDNAIVDVAILPTAKIDRTVLYRTLTHKYWHDGEEIQEPQGYKSLSESLEVTADGLRYTSGGTVTETAWADVTDEIVTDYASMELLAAAAEFGEAGFFKLEADTYVFGEDVTEECVYQLWHNPSEEAGKYIEVTSGTTDYNDLENNPKINGTTLQGDVEIPTGATLETEAQNFAQAVITDGDNVLEIYPVGNEVSLKFEKGAAQRIKRLATTEYVDGKAMQHFVVDEERLIGDWTEGGVTYDLYEKVVAFGALPNNAQKQVEHGVSDKVRFVDVKGFAYGGNNLSLPFVNANGTLYIYLGVGGSKITIEANSDRSGLTGYIYLTFIRSKE